MAGAWRFVIAAAQLVLIAKQGIRLLTLAETAPLQKHHQHYLALDALRGVAALVVMQRHMPNWFGGFVLPGGYLAVDLFFVLSGFVLAYAYEERLRGGWSFGQFLVTRAIRIWPLYLLGLALTIAAKGWHGNEPAILMALFILPEFWALHFGWFVPSTWSLTYELGINAVWARAIRWTSTPVLVGASALGLVLLVFCALTCGDLSGGWQGDTVVVGVARVLFSFPVGVLLYRYRDRLHGLRPGWAGWPALCLLGLAVCLPGELEQRGLVDLLVIVGALPVIIIFASGARPLPSSAAIFSALGSISYAIFVLHGAVIRLVARNAPEFVNPAGAFVLMGALAVACLAIDTYLDRPIRRWLLLRTNTRSLVPGRART